jgi:steroid 5-alpha reductase family enzyme
MTLAELAALLGLNLVLITAVMLGLWGVAIRLGRVGFVDGVWPLGMLLLALASFGLTQGDPVRKGLLVWLCAVWAVRLGWRLLHQWRRDGEPGRYSVLLEGSFGRTSLVLVFLPQAVMIWIMALPVQLGQVGALPPIGWTGWLGAGIVVAGIAFENIADAQMWAFRRHPDNAGRAMEAGLWRYTRHPGYFGDACVWWGLWLLAAETGWVGAASVLGPLLMTYTLRRWCGLGADGAEASPISAFIPRPPRRFS